MSCKADCFFLQQHHPAILSSPLQRASRREGWPLSTLLGCLMANRYRRYAQKRSRTTLSSVRD